MVKTKKIKHRNYSNKLKAFLKRNVLSCFLKMARLLLVLIVNGSEFHKTGAAWAKTRSPSVAQLTFGTNRSDFPDERRA